MTQEHTNWQVWASDDSSVDQTPEILNGYRNAWGADKFSIQAGPGKGFAANFLSLLSNPSIEADYYAFSDQDDVWDEKKISRALSELSKVPGHTPALYCGRTRLVDDKNKEIGLSPLFSRPPCFANALLQNIGGGNTMLFNRRARNLVATIGSQADLVSHDWWTYMVVTGCGGKVFYDPVPYVRYRQHGDNSIGANRGLYASLVRVKKILDGRYRHWIDINLAALDTIRSNLTPENRIILDSFSRARTKSRLTRASSVLSSGVHRQRVIDDIGIVLASFFNKI